MKRKRSWLSAVVLAALALPTLALPTLTACLRLVDDPPCSTREDCEDGKWCVNSPGEGQHCRDIPCAVPGKSCEASEYCTPDRRRYDTLEDGSPVGTCVPRCTAAACAPWRCLDTGECGTDCVQNTDCADGAICNSRNGYYRCVAAECSESDPSACNGKGCKNGLCPEPCDTDEACIYGERCTDGVCIPLVSCNDYSDCAANERCDGIFCRLKTSCTHDSNCGDGDRCEAGFCERAPGCVTDAECGGYACQDARCLDNCLTESDCAESYLCDTTTQLCVFAPNCTNCAAGCNFASAPPACNECTEEYTYDCPSSAPYCANNRCVECMDDYSCQLGDFCIGNRCVECTTGSDCGYYYSCIDGTCKLQ